MLSSNEGKITPITSLSEEDIFFSNYHAMTCVFGCIRIMCKCVRMYTGKGQTEVRTGEAGDGSDKYCLLRSNVVNIFKFRIEH